MLVDRAERLDRGLPGEDLLAIGSEPLAETLRPELAEPVGNAEERIGIGHHDQYLLAFVCSAR